ncbi:DUF1127 domain-containing protein [Metapseudomonas boanensis]|uniref:DUF1127 domain-containing protein n=1 Tax=Metapseudomonas boanensis TaxID=2822138 RepID=A0ABS5XIC7_9GAMM|nr:DUF1127 domain-containing protein [Pseudomonas boanensis]MBT8767443.1 DUF1127 domain-containing protein [Pseudomonas boanensis]
MERTLTATVLPQLSRQHSAWPLRVFATISLWLRNIRTRQQLAQLDRRALADAGITPAERCMELEKPFWR